MPAAVTAASELPRAPSADENMAPKGADPVVPSELPPAVRAYLEALQKRIRELEQKLNQGQSPAVTPPGALPAPSAPAPLPPVPSARTLTAPVASRLQIGGYAEFRISNYGNAIGDRLSGGHDKVDFELNRFRPRFAYFMDDHWEADLQLNAQSLSTANAATLINTRDAYIEWHNGRNNNLAVRFGQEKIPWGFEDFVEGDEPRVALERARIMEAFIPTQRDLGMEMVWNPRKLPLAQAYFRGPLFSVGVFNGNGINRVDNNQNKDVAATVRLPLGGHNTVGLSGITGSFTSAIPGPALVHQAGDFDWESYWGNFSTQLELVAGRNLGHDINGGYGQLDYLFGKVGHAFFKYDWYDPASDLGHQYWHRTSIGWYKDFTRNVRITAEYDWVTNKLNSDNIHPNTFGIEFQGNF